MQAIKVLSRSDTPLSTLSDPPQLFELDWYGAKLPEPVRYWLFVSSTALSFAGYLPARDLAVGSPGSDAAPSAPMFVEGLWRTAALELFLKDDSGDDYIELHLAPNGDFWAGYFPDIRRQDESWRPPDNSLSVNWLDYQGLRVPCLSIPLSDLPIACAFDEKSRGAVCAMWKLENGYRYVSVFASAEASPDFHQPARFLPFCGIGTKKLR